MNGRPSARWAVSSVKDVLQEIIECRHAIREHRDAKGDDRCWLDDYAVWALIPGSFPVPAELPPFDAGMDMCRAFYKLRRATSPDVPPPGAVHDPQQWDSGLGQMDDGQLAEELVRLKTAILRHRNCACNPLTINDDRDLYGILPEKLPADFRLPPLEDFLGEAKAPDAGCPAFWRSHAGCKTKRHDLHKWGPCDSA